jgi:glycoside/pentoside/hexuronide:cation symporter, GPH family
MLAAYASLRAPLAMLELPLFIVIPELYATTFGLGLAGIGLVLLCVRGLDAVADPLLGAYLANATSARLRRALSVGVPFMLLSFAALLIPTQLGLGPPSLTSLAIASGVCYLAYSLVSISYQAFGSLLGANQTMRLRISSAREGAGLAGVLAALLLIGAHAYGWLTLAFGVLLLLSLAWFWAMPLPEAPVVVTSAANKQRPLANLRSSLVTPGFRPLLAVFLLNGIASAIPATLLQFYVRDVLKAPNQFAWFLLTYFIAALLGLPAWLWLAKRRGAVFAWLVGMAVAILAFIFAIPLGAGDTMAFGAICLITGLALGADLVMPSALLAQLIDKAGLRGTHDASFFGLWSLATKLNLALAAGLALPLLALSGYAPLAAITPSATLALTLIYAAVPCLLKLCATAVLWHYKERLDSK